jgi:general secretion pathway protein D
MRTVLAAAATCCLFLTTPVAAAESAPAANAPPSESSIPLERLIANVAHKTGKTFVLDPRVHADVVIIGRSSSDLTYGELLGVLDTCGYTAVEDAGFVRVVPDAAIRTLATPTITAKDARPASEYVTQIITVKNISAAQLVPILRPLVPQSGSLVAYPATNSLVIVDRFANVRRVEGLIRTLDSAPFNKTQAAAAASDNTGTEH